MTSPTSRPVARLSTPGDVVATVPVLCGFTPQDSVVLLSLRGPRRRVGLTVRADLPPPEAGPAVAAMLAGRLADDGATAAVIVVYSELVPALDLVEELVVACRGRGVEVSEALHVRAGRWTSYLCAGPCCPADGTEVPGPPTLLQAESALDGRAVLASRAELVRSLAPPTLLAATAAEQRLTAEAARWSQEVAATGPDAARRRAVAALRACVEAVSTGEAVDAATAARVAVALGDVAVRDDVATWGLGECADALLSVLEQVLRQVVAPYDAPACTVLAWVAYCRGDGARVNVALDRALTSDPSYSLARLLRTAMDAALPPEEVRRTLQAVRVTQDGGGRRSASGRQRRRAG